MTGDRFAADEVFDEDYLYFYGPYVDGVVADAEAELLVELLRLEPGQLVLDAGCGHGRIARALARDGFDVVGVDRSRPFLDAARRGAESDGLALDLRLGDLRQLEQAFEGGAAGVICWFTTLGYHDDDVEREVLLGLCRALRAGGRLVVEHVPRDAWLREFGTGQVLVREGNFMLDRHRFDPAQRRLHVTRWVDRDGLRRRVAFSIRLFDAKELGEWMCAAGLEDVELLDGDGLPYVEGADRMIAVGLKP